MARSIVVEILLLFLFVSCNGLPFSGPLGEFSDDEIFSLLSELEELGQDVNCTMGKSEEHDNNQKGQKEENRGKAEWDQLEQAVAAAMACRLVPGMAIAVTVGENVVFNKGFGIRDTTNNLPVNENTLFGIGSTTKAFTAAFITQLVEQKVLRWDTKVRDLYSGFKSDDSPDISNSNFIDLCSHRTGMARCDELWASDTKLTAKEMVDSIAYIPPQQPFRSGSLYNNHMWSAAGAIAAWQINSTWDIEIEKRIFNKLEMKNTTTSTRKAIMGGNYAFPHGFNYITNSIQPYNPLVNLVIEKVGPAGSIVSSINDLTRWTRFLNAGGKNHLGEQIIGEKNLQFTFEPQVFKSLYSSLTKPYYPESYLSATYGLGWNHGLYGGNKHLSHTGGTVGHQTLIAVLPERKVSVIILSNSDTAQTLTFPLMTIALDIALGLTPWINVSNICSFPCPWDPSCSSSPFFSRKFSSESFSSVNFSLSPSELKSLRISRRAQQCRHKLVELFSDRTYRNFMKKLQHIPKIPMGLIGYAGNYTHPGFGTITIIEENNRIVSIYGNQYCFQVYQAVDIFLLNCTAPYYLGNLIREIFFTRSGNGLPSALHVTDYDFVIPAIIFTKSDYLPQLWPYPRFQPVIPNQP